MPCTYTGSLEGDRAMMAKEALDEATARACRMGRILKERGLLGTLEIEDLRWWLQHKEDDAAREREEGSDGPEAPEDQRY